MQPTIRHDETNPNSGFPGASVDDPYYETNPIPGCQEPSQSDEVSASHRYAED